MSAATASSHRGPPTLEERWAGMRRAAERGLFVFSPLVVTGVLVVVALKAHAVAFDFQTAYYPAATRLLQGASPYAVTARQLAVGTAFVYPAFSAIVFIPFALVPSGVAQALDTALCLACVPATLWTLNVRDWRLYGLAMLWSPVFDGWQTGNVTLPLVLGVALTWRYRDRPLVAGLLTAAAISIKPFVWPLGLWLLATRRYRAAGWALVWGVVLNLVAWSVVGFSSFGTYLRLSARVTSMLWRGGYAVLAVAAQLGLGQNVGYGMLLGLAVLAAAAVFYLGFLRSADQSALTVAVLLMLIASPLVWNHYFCLLLVPLALGRPRLSVAWIVGLVMWPLPPRLPIHAWEQAIAWGAALVVTAVALGGARGHKESENGRQRWLTHPA